MSRGESLTAEPEETPLDSARTRSILSRVREDGGGASRRGQYESSEALREKSRHEEGRSVKH